jgi:transposase-like protein
MRRRRQGHLITVLGNLGMLREEHEAELRELVSQAIAAGAPTHELARALGVSRATVWRRFRDELRTGAQQTGVTSTAFGIYRIEGGFSPIGDQAKDARRRVAHRTRLPSAPRRPTVKAGAAGFDDWTPAALRSGHAPLSAKPCSGPGVRAN